MLTSLSSVEHTLITIMATIGLAPVYSLNVVVAENLYFNANLGIGFTFLLVLSSQMFGLGFAGLCRRFLVWPAAMLWPQALVVSTLLNTFHAENDGQDGSMTRYKYLGIVSAASFFWYFLPGYLFTGLSAFSYICWIFPSLSLSPATDTCFADPLDPLQPTSKSTSCSVSTPDSEWVSSRSIGPRSLTSGHLWSFLGGPRSTLPSDSYSSSGS